MKVLVTGASGFVGQALCADLLAAGFDVRGALREFRPSLSFQPISNSRIEYVAAGEIDDSTDWSAALNGVEAVVHLAARVHVMRDTADDPLLAFRQVNVAGAERLARMAAAAGVHRFVYVSTVKVHGESTRIPATEKDSLNPVDPYAISKWEAEQVLQRVAAKTEMETVIVRPPLVYGPGVRANFLSLLRLVDRGVPLPFSGIRNRRSLIYVGNLVDALIACVTHPRTTEGVYLVSDKEAVATPDLIRHIGTALGRAASLFYLPPGLLRAGARLVGKEDEIDRLTGSLEVDSGKLREELNWHPRFSLQEGLAETVKWFRSKA